MLTFIISSLESIEQRAAAERLEKLLGNEREEQRLWVIGNSWRFLLVF